MPPSLLADRYRIEREIGHGGMAIVYLARDLKQDRPVAVKVLRPEVAAALGPERFLREIEIASRLNHPHILPLHDSGQADGILFYVMPLVEGESLRQRLIRTPQLPLEEALQITREVVSALSYAHRHDVVHRDIKPENILLSGGVALVADFGIARALTSAGDEQLTSTGVSVGTPAYMSPEQVHDHEAIDGRSDQYSLGCVLYEMLAGVPPFTGPTQQAILARHVLDPVPPLRTLRGTVPSAIEQAVERSLSKAPVDRFPTLEAFQDAFTRPAPRRPARHVTRLGVLAGAALVLLAAGFAFSRYVARRASPTAVAVLPFVTIGGDSTDEYFSDGMTGELTAALGRIPGLQVAARTSAFSFKRKQATAQTIGRALQVGSLVEGVVRRSGNRIRVEAQLINAADGYQLWADQYERDVKDVFAVQDEITRAIVGALQVKLAGSPGTPLVKPSTDNPEAHDLYLRGRYFFAKRDSVSLRKAREYFLGAIARDSAYALAYAGLADSYSHYSVFGFATPRDVYLDAKTAALRALALDSTLAEVHTSVGFIALFLEWDWRTAQRELERALALNPNYAEAHLFHGWYFVATGRLDDAVNEAREAVRLEPFWPIGHVRLSDMLLFAGHYDQALAQTQRLLELDSSFFQAPTTLTRLYTVMGRCDEAMAAAKRAAEQSAAPYQGIRGWATARCGRRAEAGSLARRLRALAQTGQYVSHYSLAMIAAGLDDSTTALAELELAYTERAWTMFMMTCDPAFARLKSDPHFVQLAKRVAGSS